jgi:hypothetical protein
MKMNITGEITGIKYKVILSEELQIVDIADFNINKVPSSCLLKDKKQSFALSKWVSPKRTRSYPYERVYNTLNTSKKITVIPVIKEEGKDGDRDFLQWDTVSLMSLLDVFVIFAYYDKANKNIQYKNKITDFQFNNDYVISKIREIEHYHSSALHWNLNELKNNLHDIVDTANKNHEKISEQYGIELHRQTGINSFKEKIGKNVENFMQFSREKAERAQAREIATVQPKEVLSTYAKNKITITNYLGGQYFFTVDEVSIKKNTVFLIENKHSINSILPNKSDIKDGLLKMILYSNLCNVEINKKQMKCESILNLTSTKLVGKITSKSCATETGKFMEENNLNIEKQTFVSKLFKEANDNNFTVKIGFTK